jgi:hypothetical protein
MCEKRRVRVNRSIIILNCAHFVEHLLLLLSLFLVVLLFRVLLFIIVLFLLFPLLLFHLFLLQNLVSLDIHKLPHNNLRMFIGN